MSFLIFIFLNLIFLEVNALESNTYKIQENVNELDLKKNETYTKEKNKSPILELKEIPKTSVSNKEKIFLRERNPFLPPGNDSNTDNSSIKISGIIFKGIAKVGSESVVFIESNKETNSYQIGQDIGGGFKISKIDSENLEVEISNQNTTHSLKLEKDE